MKISPRLGLILQYIIGIAMLICAAAMLSDGSVAGAIVLGIGALVCMPASRKIIEQRMGKTMSNTAKYTIIIAAWLSIALFAKPVKENEKPAPAAIAATTSLPSADTTVVVSQPDTVAPVNKNASYASSITTTTTTVSTVSDKANNTGVSTNSNNAAYSAPVRKAASVKKWKGYGRSRTSGNSGYITGPRGGCYYINSSGRKVYVDHSYCN